MSIFSNFKSNEYINVVNMISDTKIITKGPYKMNFYNDVNESILKVFDIETNKFEEIESPEYIKFYISPNKEKIIFVTNTCLTIYQLNLIDHNNLIGEKLLEIEIEEKLNFNDFNLVINNDNTHIILLNYITQLYYVFDILSGECIISNKYNIQNAESILLSNDNNYMVICGFNGFNDEDITNTIEVWDIKNKKYQHLYQIPELNIENEYGSSSSSGCVLISNNNNYLIIGCDLCSINIYNIKNGELLYILNPNDNNNENVLINPQSYIKSSVFLQNDELIAAGTSDGNIIIWNYITKKMIGNFKIYNSWDIYQLYLENDLLIINYNKNYYNYENYNQYNYQKNKNSFGMLIIRTPEYIKRQLVALNECSKYIIPDEIHDYIIYAFC
jgi:WD40 repeat protein